MRVVARNCLQPNGGGQARGFRSENPGAQQLRLPAERLGKFNFFG